MEFDLTWAFLALPVAFAAGWLASRFDLRQWRVETRSAPKSYFKGLNYLLNEQQDQAIDAFIEAVQQDPDTTDLHFALGNLFRRRGDYDRAVRVHEHLLNRADLPRADRDRALHALALDFTKAGILDRAEASLKQLANTPYRNEALLTLLSLYERTSDWPQAIDTARQLEASDQGSFQPRIAHYLCETAREALHKAAQATPQDPAAAVQAAELLQQAQATCPEAARPRVDTAKLQESQGGLTAACQTLLSMATEVPAALPLVAGKLAALAIATGQQAAAHAVLTAAQAKRPCIDYVEALATLVPKGDNAATANLYLAHLQQEPSLVVATNWLRLPPSPNDVPGNAPMPDTVSKALTAACKPLRRYRCAACGFEAAAYFWQCPGCQSWDSYNPRRVEEL
ncbi:MAG: lipopolysaccharide assembly protein LapB [Burkholderiales bacterium]|nr:lipopolysaccharide assembly protein LapB [Burkholderiales bacterium]